MFMSGSDLPNDPSAAEERPFKVSVQAARDVESVEADDQIDETDQPLSLDEIEAAYLRALESADAADALVPPELIASVPDVAESMDDLPPPAKAPAPSPDAEMLLVNGPDDEPLPVQLQQVVEALLFVGGEPLPTKRFVDLLGGGTSAEDVTELIEKLNQRYIGQRRPYEIRLLEGGYRLQLRDEYESVRRKVYGQGPKEVKLAQEALEVLAFIAYRQPVTKANLDETGRQNLSPLLRQLLRRELILLQRDESNAEVYRTTPRFLDLFGLKTLDDLPMAGDFNFK